MEYEFEEKFRQAEVAFAKGDFFSAGFFYKDALKLARKLGNSDRIKVCKQKMVEANHKSKDQMQEHSFEQQIPKEEIEKFINSVLKKGDLPQILKFIGTHPALYPRFKTVEASAKKTMPATFHFANLSTFSPEGHLVKGGEDPVFHWLMKMYEINQNIILQIYLLNLFRELIHKKGLNKEVLVKYFRDRGVFTENFLKIIRVGLERYFSGDYISALHILIPQFEGAFLFLSEKLGIDIVALDQKEEISTRTKVLSGYYLSSEAFTKIWGEDLCQQIKFVLFEPMGFKLRHKVAHGEVVAEECNYANSTLIIYLFLVLSARVETKTNTGL